MDISIITTILTVCSAIIGVSTVINLIINIADKMRQPNVEQNNRLAALEADVKEIKQKLDSDYARIMRLETGDETTHKALLALLKHAINGNDIDGMKEVQTELEDYLIKRSL